MSLSVHCGAVVLCGGKSSRMGQPKHLLRFGECSVLEVVVQTLSQITERIVIVAAPDQPVPTLPAHCQIVRDAEPHLGPLSGLRYGMQALLAEDISGTAAQSPAAASNLTVRTQLEAVYLTGCDVPLLQPAFVQQMLAALQAADLAIPSEAEFLHPLAGVYRLSLLPVIEELLTSGERRPRKLVEQTQSVLVPVEELRKVDAQLLSLRNMNTPEDYRELLTHAGLSVPPEML